MSKTTTDVDRLFGFGKFRKFRIRNLVAEKAENKDRCHFRGWTFFRGRDFIWIIYSGYYGPEGHPTPFGFESLGYMSFLGSPLSLNHRMGKLCRGGSKGWCTIWGVWVSGWGWVASIGFLLIIMETVILLGRLFCGCRHRCVRGRAVAI